MTRQVRIGVKVRTITSWPGSSGPSRGNDTRERFQCLARGVSPKGDSPHEAGYDSGEAAYDCGEAAYDSGEAGCDSGIAMLAPMGEGLRHPRLTDDHQSQHAILP